LINKKAILVLEDGAFYEGSSFGATSTTYGEVVFNTSMTGYQEMLTDPSYAGQILMPTYPLIGNYGINKMNFESKHIQARGFAIRECCHQPSHRQSEYTLHEFLISQNVPGISGIDTRAVTRHIRSGGVMMGIISSDMTIMEAQEQVRNLPKYDATRFVQDTGTDRVYAWQEDENTNRKTPSLAGDKSPHIAVIDYGVKYSILRILRQMGCHVTVVPHTSSADNILAAAPDGILLSPGPGDPSLLQDITETVKKLAGQKPMMGICLGHQLIGQALGAKTFKLKFGHRGGNHPVRDIATGRVYITAQNHGYALDAATLKGGLDISHISLNDGTVEGLRHQELSLITIQYHAEASPGPLDNLYLFERFLEMVKSEEKL